MLNELLLIFDIVIFGVVFTEVIIAEDGIMSFYFRWIQNLPFWLYKPLGGCTACFIGQISFWSFLFNFAGVYDIDFDVVYNFAQNAISAIVKHILFVSKAIFAYLLIKNLL